MSWGAMRTDNSYFHCGCNKGHVTITTITEQLNLGAYNHKLAL